MQQAVIDLRSDTVTQPTDAMREAMAKAPVGDDVYGEDDSVNQLERKVAQLAGKEAALLCSSGTQSNLIAIMTHCQRGEEYIVGQSYHTFKYEAGGAAVLGGIVPHTLQVQDDATLKLEELAAAIKVDDPHFPISRLIALENTHLGQVVAPEYVAQVRTLANAHGLRMHLDGARLFNASVASARSIAELSAPFESVSLCCSKGLGAPVGSLLCGDEVFIRRARRWRKMLGGGMRQAGVLAAAIDHALEHHVQRLAHDHAHAQALAQGIEPRPGVRVDAAQTNMLCLHFEQESDAQAVASLLAAQGIRVPAQQAMRLVTHLDVSEEQVEQVILHMNQALEKTLSA
jgi:threonine aldolase